MDHRTTSRNEYFQLFLVCVLPIHVWAILVFLRRMPTMLTQLNAFEIVGVAAYVLAFALLESLLLFGILYAVERFLFRRFLKLTPLPVGTVCVFLASATAAMIHLYRDWDIQAISFNLWSVWWAAVGLMAIGLLLAWLKRNQNAEQVILQGVERLSILSMVYLFFDLVGVVVILVRNI
jgi:hypothetical protein